MNMNKNDSSVSAVFLVGFEELIFDPPEPGPLSIVGYRRLPSEEAFSNPFDLLVGYILPTIRYMAEINQSIN